MKPMSIKKLFTLALVLCLGCGMAFAQGKIITNGWQKVAKNRAKILEHLRAKNPGAKMGLLEQIATKLWKEELARRAGKPGTVIVSKADIQRAAAQAVPEDLLPFNTHTHIDVDLNPASLGAAHGLPSMAEMEKMGKHEANLVALYKNKGALPTSLSNPYLTPEERAVTEDIINNLADSFFYEHGYFPQTNGTSTIDGVPEFFLAREMMLVNPIPWHEMLNERAEYGNACTKYYFILKGYLFEKGSRLSPGVRFPKEEKRIADGIAMALQKGNPETREYQLLKKLYDYAQQFPQATNEEPFWEKTEFALKTDTPFREQVLPQPTVRIPLPEDVASNWELAQERKAFAQWRQQNIELQTNLDTEAKQGDELQRRIEAIEREQALAEQRALKKQLKEQNELANGYIIQIRTYNEWLDEMEDTYRHLKQTFQKNEGMDLQSTGLKAQTAYYRNLLKTRPFRWDLDAGLPKLISKQLIKYNKIEMWVYTLEQRRRDLMKAFDQLTFKLQYWENLAEDFAIDERIKEQHNILETVSFDDFRRKNSKLKKQQLPTRKSEKAWNEMLDDRQNAFEEEQLLDGLNEQQILDPEYKEAMAEKVQEDAYFADFQKKNQDLDNNHSEKAWDEMLDDRQNAFEEELFFDGLNEQQVLAQEYEEAMAEKAQEDTYLADFQKKNQDLDNNEGIPDMEAEWKQLYPGLQLKQFEALGSQADDYLREYREWLDKAEKTYYQFEEMFRNIDKYNISIKKLYSQVTNYRYYLVFERRVSEQEAKRVLGEARNLRWKHPFEIIPDNVWQSFDKFIVPREKEYYQLRDAEFDLLGKFGQLIEEIIEYKHPKHSKNPSSLEKESPNPRSEDLPLQNAPKRVRHPTHF